MTKQQRTFLRVAAALMFTVAGYCLFLLFVPVTVENTRTIEEGDLPYLRAGDQEGDTTIEYEYTVPRLNPGRESMAYGAALLALLGGGVALYRSLGKVEV